MKPLRILRALRPLRLVSRSPGMKLMVTSLVKSLPAVSNTLGVVLAFMLGTQPHTRDAQRAA